LREAGDREQYSCGKGSRDTSAVAAIFKRMMVHGQRARREVCVWPEIIDGVRLNCSRRTVKLPGILHPLTISRTLNRARRLSFNYSSPRPLHCSFVSEREGVSCRPKSFERLTRPAAGSSDDRLSFVG